MVISTWLFILCNLGKPRSLDFPRFPLPVPPAIRVITHLPSNHNHSGVYRTRDHDIYASFLKLVG